MAVGLMTVPVIIVLMILLCFPEHSSFFNRCHNLVSFGFQLIDKLFSNLFLLSISIKNGLPVLRTNIRPLPVEFGRIVNLKKEFCKGFVADQ